THETDYPHSILTLIYHLFFLHHSATTKIDTLSLHDALPISEHRAADEEVSRIERAVLHQHRGHGAASFVHTRLQHRGHGAGAERSEEHTSELQSPDQLVCRLLLEKK